LDIWSRPIVFNKEQLDSRIRLEEKRKPILSIFAQEAEGIPIITGVTTEVVSGRRQSIGNGIPPDVLNLVCKNASETRAKNCVARLISAKRIDADGREVAKTLEAIDLPWGPVTQTEKLSQDIEQMVLDGFTLLGCEVGVSCG
jgi:hypothetical protein